MYLNTVTNEYPRFDGDLELLGWTVGEPLPENWVKVEYVDPPVVGVDETYQITEPTLHEDGVWRIGWTVRAMTPEEIERRDNPPERDRRRRPIS